MRLNVNLIKMTAYHLERQEEMILIRSMQNNRRRREKTVDDSIFHNQYNIKEAFENKFQNKICALGQRWMLLNGKVNPSMDQVMQGLKKHYIRKLPQLGPRQTFEWDT